MIFYQQSEISSLTVRPPLCFPHYLETECMDPEMEHHYKQVLSEWKKNQGNIKDELKEIGTKMADVMKKLDDLTAATVTNREESRDEGELEVFF